jgi:hypothetical protein
MEISQDDTTMPKETLKETIKDDTTMPKETTHVLVMRRGLTERNLNVKSNVNINSLSNNQCNTIVNSF